MRNGRNFIDIAIYASVCYVTCLLQMYPICEIAAHYNVSVTIHRSYHLIPSGQTNFQSLSQLLSPPSGDRSLNIGLNCRQNSENCEALRIPFQTFHSRCRCHAVWNPRLNCFSCALRVHLRYVSSYADAPSPRPHCPPHHPLSLLHPIQSIRFITSGSVSGIVRFENSYEGIDWRIPFGNSQLNNIVISLCSRANCRGCVNLVNLEFVFSIPE